MADQELGFGGWCESSLHIRWCITATGRSVITKGLGAIDGPNDGALCIKIGVEVRCCSIDGAHSRDLSTEHWHTLVLLLRHVHSQRLRHDLEWTNSRAHILVSEVGGTQRILILVQ